jgi:hypothetical protein
LRIWVFHAHAAYRTPSVLLTCQNVRNWK